ncbi:hypothetical protein B0H11DRAFT_2290152 [Mycena galericulata]|nr:hypothetical protein B0H11DRAFT_2290152 [Mycena galericulata]
MYMVKGGKALASTLEDLSRFIPVPFLGEFMKVAIAVLQACEDATAIEENVKDLQGRVYNLTLVIIDKVPVGSSADEDLQDWVRNLQSILSDIIEDLNEIKQQKKWLLLFFRDVNKEKVDRCVGRVNAALEQFNVSHQLRVEELLDKIKSNYSSVTNQLDRIEEAVKKTNQPHTAQQTLPRQDMPPAQRVFYGRESIVNDVASLLSREDTSRVCITGAGGMGKTSVALAVIHSPAVKELFSNYRFWVPCVEALSADLLRRILYTQLRITAESYDSLDPLIKELNSSKERRLLLLDNFETPWLSGENQNKITDILVRLTALPHIALIVTMASQFPPSEDSVEWQHCPLLPLDPAAARDTFKRLYPGAANAPKLDELLTAVGHIPLAITLMAADGKHLQATPKDLLKEWRNAGTEMNSTMDRRIGLSVHRVELNTEAFRLLAILSMLPAGTTGNNLRWWAPTLISHSAAVVALRTAALIEQDEGHDEALAFSYAPRSSRRKSIPDDANFKRDLEELAEEETNVQGLLMQIDASNMCPHALDALIAFGLYQSWTKPSTSAAIHALELANAAKDSRRIAEAHHCLGRIFHHLSLWDEACQHFEEARGCFKKLSGGADHIRAGECTMQLANTWMYMLNKSSHELGSFVKEAQADLSQDASDKYHVARGLLGVDIFLRWAGRRDESLETTSAAKEIFEELGCLASTADCLHLLARIHASRKEYTIALAIARKALSIAEPVGDIDLTSRICYFVAHYFMALSIFDDEALSMVERALSMDKAMGSTLGVGQNLENLGYLCAGRKDFRAARLAYEAARTNYATIQSTSMGRKGEQACATNLEILQDLTEMDELSFSRLISPIM